MAEFHEVRESLRSARDSLHAAQDELTRARQETLRLEAAYAQARRAKARDGNIEELRVKLEKARKDELKSRKRVKGLETELTGAADRYADAVDPAKLIETWSDRYPVLLFPVRLEARFRQGKAGEPREQLWVRIYPDDCCVDSFEAELSDTEIKSVERYWTEWWQAGGDDPQRRSAWRNLVASHGSGRATWITRQYAPVHPAPEPVKARPQDLVLVIRGARPAAQATRDALSAYWIAVWRAAGNTTQLTDATNQLTGSGVGAPGPAPANFDIAPGAPEVRATVPVTVSWLELPAPTPLSAKARSWTIAPTARALPDAFVIMGFQNGQVVFQETGKPVPARLTVAPDPSAPVSEQIRHDTDGELIVPEAMRWMVDFEAAVDVGLGLKISLHGDGIDPNAPIERLLALGIRLADDPEEARQTLEELLTHHRFGRSGFAFVPQGSPTNNTDSDGTAFGRGEDSDAAYDANRQVPPPPADWWNRSDGQWLADLLGVTPTVFDGVPHASGRDFSEARALNRALWPATFGYTLETMMHPVFSAAQVANTRWFFTHFVSGRGLLPAVRIDAQPYGVLPVMPLSKIKWPLAVDREALGELSPPADVGPFVAGLARLLAAMRTDWKEFSNAVTRIGGGGGDPHQMLLDIVGLHPASVEMHQRYAESLEHIFNQAKYSGIAGLIAEHVRTASHNARALQLLRRLGYQGEPTIDALEKFFFSRSNRLNGPLIDDRPLSESEPIRPYAADSVRNYLAWLADAAQNSFEDLRLERGFKNDKAPDALLYVMLRHALMLEYWDTSLRLFQSADLLNAGTLAQARREPAFVHVAANDTASESHFTFLYSKDARVTQDPNLRVADHIRDSIGAPRAANLTEQLAAIRSLSDLPTARLERCLAEHIDVASHRLDAWLLGLVHYQFASLRYGRAPREPQRQAHSARRGVYLGAFGVLENLRRKPAALPVFQPSDRFHQLLAPRAFDAGTAPAPLLRDPSNGGFVFAPSLNQASTAAVLRAGYLANATPGTPSPLALNLSSRRVRVALQLVEGIRNGQPLGALLGYQFQRGLHEGHAPLELDRFIYPLRKAFPLVADQMSSTRSGTNDPIEAIEANNVLDGLKLIEHVRKGGNASYPFGLPRAATATCPADPPMPAASVQERTAIDIEVDRLLDAHDALADLALAEGVHQAVLGNYDGVAATLDAFAKGTFPPEPNVVRTPRSGLALTHRVGIHFSTGLDHTVSPLGGVDVSPRSMALPMVNNWLFGLLPPAAEIGCLVRWIDPATGTAKQDTVTQLALTLQPIDLLHIATLDGAVSVSELDDRITAYILDKHKPRSDVVLDISHATRLADPMKTFFEIAPMVRSLRALLLRSRALAPTDLTLANEAERAHDSNQALDKTAVKDIRDELVQLRADVAALVPAAPVDGIIDAIVLLFARATSFGIQQVGWGSIYDWRRQVFSGVLARVQAVIDRWGERLTRFADGLTAYDAIVAGTVSDSERFTELGRLELLVAAATTDTRPANPTDYRAALPARRNAMNAKRDALLAIVGTADRRVVALIDAVKAELPLDALDPTPFSIDDFERDLVLFVPSMQARLVALLKELDKRIKAGGDALTAHDATSDPLARLGALQQAGGGMLGEEVRLIPEITFSAERAAELAAAYAASASGALTSFLTNQRGVDFPVDDFLSGIARVREKLQAWEETAVLAATFGNPEPVLTPLQLPHRPGEGWLALEIDPAAVIDGSRLLYTAHFAPGAATPSTAGPSGKTCGLVIDEWSEVIPARDETAGVAVQFDRPNSEPPQTWLLAASPAGDGKWHWQDLVDCVDEALALARLRAVQPAQVETKEYARFLPATVSAATLYGVTLSANFARVNAFATELRTLDG
jgi:hypothetical protein